MQNFKANQWTNGTTIKNNFIEPDTVQFAGERAFHYVMSTGRFNGGWESFPLQSGQNYVYELTHKENYFLIVYSHDLALEKILKTFKFN
jgi:hypothetical protein